MNDKISIIGGGSWGTALGQLLAVRGLEILIYVRDGEVAENINQHHINQKYFPKSQLSSRLRATTDLEQVVDFARYQVLAVPTGATREIMREITQYLQDNQAFISTAKGLETGTFLRNSEIIKEYSKVPVAALSGPTHSEEVIQGLPTAAVIASENTGFAEEIQQLFRPTSLRLYASPDLVGVELAGAVKNIMAVAAGIGDGVGYGDNARASLITRGLAELGRLGGYFGGRTGTFSGLAGLGDLVVTCNSMHSRNRRFGIRIGQGMSREEALEDIGQTVEGVYTTRSIHRFIGEHRVDLELPITAQVYQVLFENKDPRQAVNELMQRGPKYEVK